MLFERERVLKWKHIEDIARRKLRDLDKVTSLEELVQIPSNHLHKLFGDRKGQKSITIKDQYRICFLLNKRQRLQSKNSRLSLNITKIKLIWKVKNYLLYIRAKC